MTTSVCRFVFEFRKKLSVYIVALGGALLHMTGAAHLVLFHWRNGEYARTHNIKLDSFSVSCENLLLLLLHSHHTCIDNPACVVVQMLLSSSHISFQRSTKLGHLASCEITNFARNKVHHANVLWSFANVKKYQFCPVWSLIITKIPDRLPKYHIIWSSLHLQNSKENQPPN